MNKEELLTRFKNEAARIASSPTPIKTFRKSEEMARCTFELSILFFKNLPVRHCEPTRNYNYIEKTIAEIIKFVSTASPKSGPWAFLMSDEEDHIDRCFCVLASNFEEKLFQTIFSEYFPRCKFIE